MRYSTPEKYCEYGVHQVGLCLSHPPRGGGGEGWEASQSRVESCTTPGGGGTQQSFIGGGSAPRSNPLPFYIPFLTENVALSYTFHCKMVPLSHTYLYYIPFLNPWNAVYGKRILGENGITWRDVNQKSVLLSTRNILIKGPFKYINDRFPCPFIYFSSWNPYPFIYLKREKGTPFGRSLPV